MYHPRLGYSSLSIRCSALLAPTLLLALVTPLLAAPPQVDKQQIAEDEARLRSVDVSPEGPALVEFFRKRILNAADEKQIRTLIRSLGDTSFSVRQDAMETLMQIGLPARPFLREALNNQDVEVLRRSERCLETIEKVSGPEYLSSAARLLAHHQPEGAAKVLLEFIPLVEDDLVMDEMSRTLATVGFAQGEARPVLLEALKDPEGSRRAVAAEAFCLRRTPEDMEIARKMLADKDAKVRTRVGLALLDARDKSAVPRLIDLLAELPPEKVWPVEDALYNVAGEKAPSITLGATLASRAKARDAWKTWWQKEGEALDLSKVDDHKKLLGYTLVVIQDIRGRNGKVLELDEKGKVRWELETSRYPVDAKILGEDRVLVADYSVRTVTEYDKKGKVHWKATLPNIVLSAQRLPNGNTFVATRNQLIELDPKGKQISAITRSGTMYAAQRMRNGHIGVVDSVGTFYRLDSSGKELQKFSVGRIYSLGTNIEVLPSGGVIVPLYSSNQVLEFDSRGKMVRQLNANRPTAVKRLPNGNTLIGSRLASSVVEVDSQGKQVWQYSAPGRVMGVSRR